MQKLCNATFAKSKGETNRKNIYWWNAEIAAPRRECLRNKRVVVRQNWKSTTDETEKLEWWSKYKKCRKKLRKLIGMSRESAWKRLCHEILEM